MSVNSIVTSVKSVISKHLILCRIAAAVTAFAMIAWLLAFAFSLVGDPVSYCVLRSKAQKYVAENYAGKGYVLESVDYNFKVGKFYASVVKPGSEDGRFVVGLGSDGKLSDDYERRVLNGENTQARLRMRYRELADSVFKSPAYPYSSMIASGYLVFEGDERYDFALPKSILVSDELYDVSKLGEEAGLLTIYVDTEETTPEHAAEVLLEINSLMERGGVPFRAIDLTLETPLGEDQSHADRKYYSLENFRRADIYEDGLVERVKDSRQQAEERMTELEAEKKVS